MKKMPAIFTHYLWLLAAGLIAASLTLPARYGIPYPQELGPKFDAIVNQEDVRGISAQQAEVVVFGDSFVLFGVDAALVTEKLGVETYAIAMPGSASAAWYLMLKNVILEADAKPRYAVLTFRDTILTLPTYRTTGYYFEIVDNYAQQREPLVTQLAYLNALSPAEKIAEQYLPLYSARWRVREGLDARLRYALPATAGCDEECVNDALNYIFGKQKGVDVTAINSAVDDSQKVLYNDEAYDFESEVGKSFLPYMIQLAQERDITLILVRAKTLAYPTYASEPPGLRRYNAALAEYLTRQEHVVFIDLGHDERIEPAHYLDLLHFNAEGKRRFSEILAEELKKVIE